MKFSTSMVGTRSGFERGISAAALAVALAMAAPAYAQTTGTIQGTAAPGSTVTVEDTVTGRSTTVNVNADGNFVIVGLRPSNYLVKSGEGEAQDVTLPVGETVTVDLAPPAEGSEIIVTGTRSNSEVRTATIGTNISQEQMNNLPQNDRNFLNFAALAPGVTVSSDPNNKRIQAGGVSSNNVNVYIDGTSQKNQVGFGGVAGQNFSQGNPFPQAAVQEFKVETQNYKAEYEQAGSAIITAITKVGGDEFHGGVFGKFMPKSFFGQPYFDRGNPKPDFKRWQFGGDIGGPIIPGVLHFFAAYEGSRKTNPSLAVDLQAPVPADIIAAENGVFPGRFSQDLYFGKLTLFASDKDTIHASYFRRDEKDVRDFGGREVRDHGRDIGTSTKNYQAEWSHREDNWLNEFTFGYQTSFTGTPTLTDGPEFKLTNGINGGDILIAGAHFFEQANEQSAYTAKNNFTYTGLDGHVIKAGARFSKTELTRVEDAFANGSYVYSSGNFTNFASSIPYRATVALLPPTPMTAKNNQIGLFIQDDWTIDDHWTVNLGLRWDYESNNFNNKYVTPDKVATALRNYQPWQAAGIDAEDYITDGNDRSPFKGAFQPRIGVSYDVNGDRDLVLFAGAGRYYDRNIFYLSSLETLFNNIRSDVNVSFCQNANANTAFLPACNGASGQLAWNESYRDPEALRTAAGAQGLSGDIWVIKDKTPTPYTDQFTIGFRKQAGDWKFSVAFAHNRSHNNFIFVRGNRMPDGTYTPDGFAWVRDNFPVEGRPAGYTGRVNIGSSIGEARYSAMYYTVEKPYTEDSGWGVTAALTISDAKSNQAIGFDEGQMFNAGEQDAYGWQPTRGLERWRFVGTSIVNLPWDIKWSTSVTLSSGPSFGNVDFSRSAGPGTFYFNDAGVFTPKRFFAYRNVDMRIAKTFELFGSHELEVEAEVFNLFDSINRNYSTWGAGSGANPTFQENSTVGNARSFQVGAKYRF